MKVPRFQVRAPHELGHLVPVGGGWWKDPTLFLRFRVIGRAGSYRAGAAPRRFIVQRFHP